MPAQDSAWLLREFLFNRIDKSATITVVCKGKCFQIQLSPANFSHSPASLENYMRLMDSLCDDEDYELAESAEQDLYDWALGPFLPIFDKIDPPPINSHHFTLRDYFHPETYRYALFVIHECLEPRLNHTVPEQMRATGLDLGDFTLHPKWCKVRPEDIQIPATDYKDLYNQFPRKVLIGDTACFYKPVEYSDRRAAIRELEAYKKMENLGLCIRLRVPRLIGVVQDEPESHITGLLLSWVQCDNTTLACALTPETSSEMRKRWDSQVTSTVECFHDAGIIWGDVKAANVLIDVDGNAWLIDFGGGYTRGWIEKHHMETIEGDQEGLSKIKDLIYTREYF